MYGKIYSLLETLKIHVHLIQKGAFLLGKKMRWLLFSLYWYASKMIDHVGKHSYANADNSTLKQ